MPFEIVRNDIVNMQVDAVVNIFLGIRHNKIIRYKIDV